MATIKDARDALADAVRAALGLRGALGYWLNPQPSWAYVVPTAGADYASFDDGSFCKPTWALSAIVLAATSDLTVASDWIDDVATNAPTIAADDRTLGGVVSAIALEAVGEPGLVAVEGGGNVLAIELRFKRLFVAS